MAKTIKFNLILDNHPVRNIEELQEHFSIEDMLKYFENGLLLRWLKVRGYEKEYIAVENIGKSLGNKDIIISLMKIFKMSDIDTDDIEKEVSILEYQNEKKKLNEIYKENSFTKEQIIEDYHAGYNALILHIEKNKDNMAILKADAVQMEREYSRLFSLNYYELYFRLLNSAPKAIFAMLTRDIFRKYWLDEKSKSSTLETAIGTAISATTASTMATVAGFFQEGYNRITKIDERDQIKSSIESILRWRNRVKEILGDDLKVVGRDTGEMWDLIERPTVKVMVISISSYEGISIKSADNSHEELEYKDVRGKLPILDGLEYQSDDADNKLLYMEV